MFTVNQNITFHELQPKTYGSSGNGIFRGMQGHSSGRELLGSGGISASCARLLWTERISSHQRELGLGVLNLEDEGKSSHAQPWLCQKHDSVLTERVRMPVCELRVEGSMWQ